MKYEAPEVVDLGAAEEMIFGGCGNACDNVCDCAYGGGISPTLP